LHKTTLLEKKDNNSIIYILHLYKKIQNYKNLKIKQKKRKKINYLKLHI